MLGRQDGNNAGSIRFLAEIDRDVPQVGLFAPADGAVCHEDETSKRSDLPHQMVAVDPGVDALLQRKIHPWRTHLHVQQKPLGIKQRLEEGHLLTRSALSRWHSQAAHVLSLVATGGCCSSLFCIDLFCFSLGGDRYFNAIVVESAREFRFHAAAKAVRRYNNS